MWLSMFFGVAVAQSPGIPDRQIPPSVTIELQRVQDCFELALARDCAPERCFSKGCTYVDHAVADRPRATSLPGLGLEPGPGSVPSQEYLTRASCSFAYEESTEPDDVQALARRLQTKLSQGWTVVSVGHQKLPPIPSYLHEAPPPEVDETVEPEPEIEPLPPEPWSQQLWQQLLPHFFWMIAVGLLTLAAIALIWAWRRVGQASFEEQALLATLGMPEEPVESETPEETGSEEGTEDDAAFVARQSVAWDDRSAAMDRDAPDPELRALIRELLRSGDMPLLAKAVLRFPETFPAAFPTGGSVASAKLEFADYLKNVDVDALPGDADFFRALNRHALSAALVSQSDAEVVRSLREEFGAAGLVDLIGRLPARAGALLFALSPSIEQREMVRLLSPDEVAQLSEQLLLSNRMDETETAYLFDVLTAVRTNQPLPPSPGGPVSDRGPTHDATAALSVLLPELAPETRAALFGVALERFNGSLPAWYRGIFFADLLLDLPAEARVDLLLEIDVQHLGAWYSTLDSRTQERLVTGLPTAVRVSLESAPAFASQARQLAIAERGRKDLARGFQRQLTRANLSFEDVVGGA